MRPNAVNPAASALTSAPTTKAGRACAVLASLGHVRNDRAPHVDIAKAWPDAVAESLQQRRQDITVCVAILDWYRD